MQVLVVRMADIFSKAQALALLNKKYILLMGDSNMRAMYLDLIHLMYNSRMTPVATLRRRCTMGGGRDIDEVLQCSNDGTPTRHFQEVRHYTSDDGLCGVRFCFVTRVLSSQVLDQLGEISSGAAPMPDIIIINSCMWDITRWGPLAENRYKRECVQLFVRLRALVDPSTLVVWTTTLPVATSLIFGGVLVKQLEFMQASMRFMFLEANLFAAELCRLFSFNLLDLHYHMRFQLARRCGDGLHWESHAMRHITCVLLTHIALSLKLPLPGVMTSSYLRAAVETSEQTPTVGQVECRLSRDMLEVVKEILQAVLNDQPAPSAKRSGTSYDQDNRVKKKCHRFLKYDDKNDTKGSSKATVKTTQDMRRFLDSGVNKEMKRIACADGGKLQHPLMPPPQPFARPRDQNRMHEPPPSKLFKSLEDLREINRNQNCGDIDARNLINGSQGGNIRVNQLSMGKQTRCSNIGSRLDDRNVFTTQRPRHIGSTVSRNQDMTRSQSLNNLDVPQGAFGFNNNFTQFHPYNNLAGVSSGASGHGFFINYVNGIYENNFCANFNRFHN